MKKRILSLIFAVILAAGLLAACGGGGGNTPAPAGSGAVASDSGLSGTISLAMLATNQPGMEQVIADFEAANPGTHIEAEFISDLAAFSTNIPARFTAGTSTDIVHLIAGDGGATSVGAIAGSDCLEDLSNEPWVGDMYEDTKQLFMYDGKVVAMDFGFCPLACLLINDDVMAANGVEAPKTFDELLAACDKLNAAGVTPISFAGGEVFVLLNDVCVMVGNEEIADNPGWWDDMLAGKTTFADTPGARKAVEMFQQLIDAKAFSPGCAAMTQSEMVAAFASGEAAMMFTYGGHAGMVLQQDPSLHITEIPFPGSTADKSRVMVQASGGLTIAKTCQNKELAKAFLEFFRQPEEMAKFAEGASCISVPQIKEGKTEGNYVGLTGTPFIGDITARWPNTTIGQKWGTDLQGLLTGQKTVDDCIASFDVYFKE